MTRSFCKLTVLLTLGVSVVIATLNWRFYFATPMHELGDIAANALQIHQAKHGNELYGNYSRFYFNHPGPAFFYVYALGERVFRDWLAVVPSAHNAHSLASLLLQAFFFSAALALFSERFRAPLFLPLALFAAAVHFGLAHFALTSVWPPHVLLMPFLCFFAASVSVASGRGGHLPLAVLAGSFLAHGHVSQPLFVVSLFLLAYGGLWWAARGAGDGAPWRKYPGAHVAAGALAALFLLPLVIDWLRWPNDNLRLILNQLSGGSGDHKTVRQSVLYLLRFFSYPSDGHEILVPYHAAPNAHFLAEHAVWYWGWLALFGFIALGWRRLAAIGGDRPAFVRNTAGFWVAALILCVVWGTVQTSEMFQFNSYFYFSILYVPLLLAAAAASEWLPARCAMPAAVLLGMGIAAAVGRGFVIVLPPVEDPGLPVLRAAQAVLRADPRPKAPKILVFGHNDWPVITSVGLMLDRSNVPFAVDPIVGLLFSRHHWLESTPTPGAASVWRFLRRAPPGVGVPFVDGMRVAFAPGKLDPKAGTINCYKDGNLEQFVVSGLTTPEGSPAATEATEVSLEIDSVRAAHDIKFSLLARPLDISPKLPTQPMELWINGVRVAGAALDRDVVQTVALRVPAAVWNRLPVVQVVMKFPAARSPAELGINGDPRVLGWEIREIKLSYAE